VLVSTIVNAAEGERKSHLLIGGGGGRRELPGDVDQDKSQRVFSNTEKERPETEPLE